LAIRERALVSAWSLKPRAPVPIRYWYYFDKILRTCAGLALMLFATWSAYRLHLNLMAASLVQLLIVLAVALKVGFWQATALSFVANSCLDYFFISPLFAFGITDPQNWVALIVFEISALVVTRLSTEAKRQTLEAKSRRHELEQLYDVSRQLLLSGRESSVDREILSSIQNAFSIDAGVLFDASTARVERVGHDPALLEAEARGAYLQDRDLQGADRRSWVRVLRLGVRPVGAIALRGKELSSVTVNALASLAATALERAHSLERETRAEAERQSEQLRTTVLDALAHEYKTPLTTVRTAAGGLLEMGGLDADRVELVSLIESETERLSDLTTRLLQMARLDRADIRMRMQRIEVGELILGVLTKSQRLLRDHPTKLEGLENRGHIRADRELVDMALLQFLDNAAKYSDPGATITLGVSVAAGALRISVHNLGLPVAPEDREKIFQRFYRSAGSNHRAAGTGIGLSISRKVAEAHQGRVWVTSSEGNGNTFFLELPRYEKEKI
jgi:two-component system sensor histidine kinase KdpD